jgi:hypothetical protein
MPMSQRSKRDGEPPPSPGTAPPGSTQKRLKQPSHLRAVVASLLALALVLGAVAAYYGVSGFFSANGTWYGTMSIHAGDRALAIETYMDVSTLPTGSISGEGMFCVPLPFNNTSTFAYSLSGDRAFPLPGNTRHDQQWPISLTAQYRSPLLLGLTLPLGPALHMEGTVTTNSFHLIGGDGAVSTVLTLTHGDKNDFMASCKSLSPLTLQAASKVAAASRDHRPCMP